MEVEPSTWYSSRVTLPSHDPAHWRLTNQPCLCSNHHSTWALPLRPLPPPSLNASLFLDTSLSPSLFPSLSPSSLSLPLSISPPFYISPSLSPSRSFSWSLSIDAYLSTPISLSPLSLYLDIYIYIPISLPLLSLDLSPSPSISLERYPSIRRHLSISICLPLSPSLFPLSRSLTSLISLSIHLFLDTSLYPALSHRPPLWISLPSLDRYLYLPLWTISLSISIKRCLYFFITIPRSLPL